MNSLILYGQTSAKLPFSFNYGTLKATIIFGRYNQYHQKSTESLSLLISMFCQCWNTENETRTLTKYGRSPVFQLPKLSTFIIQSCLLPRNPFLQGDDYFQPLLISGNPGHSLLCFFSPSLKWAVKWLPPCKEIKGSKNFLSDPTPSYLGIHLERENVGGFSSSIEKSNLFCTLLFYCVNQMESGNLTSWHTSQSWRRK